MKNSKFFNDSNKDKIRLLALFFIPLVTLLLNSSSKNSRMTEARVEVETIKTEISSKDTVFFSTKVKEIEEAVREASGNAYSFSSNDEFSKQLQYWLLEQCQTKNYSDQNVYWIWDQDEFLTLAEATRLAYFFFDFQAVQSNLTDRIFNLILRDYKFSLFCEAQGILKLSGNKRMIVVIDTDLFSPLSGGVTHEGIIWLPNQSYRNVDYDKVLIKNWETNFLLIPRVNGDWDYFNKESKQYEQAIKWSQESTSIFLMDRNTMLGNVPELFFVVCGNENRSEIIKSRLYVELCKK